MHGLPGPTEEKDVEADRRCLRRRDDAVRARVRAGRRSCHALCPDRVGLAPLKILAPTNSAFAKLPADQLANLAKPENAEKLQQLLLYHVIPASTPASAFKGPKGDVPSATPAMLSVDGTDDALTINGAAVVRVDVAASNGIIHVVDAVLVPMVASAAVMADAPALITN